jgi:hypothetical protein
VGKRPTSTRVPTMHDNDDNKPDDRWFTKPVPKGVQGWASFLALVAFSGGVLAEQPPLAPIDAAVMQFFFCGVAWFLGSFFGR